jgi:hypothetical protein
MHDADAAQFQALRKKMEEEWTPQMTATLGINAASLPIIMILVRGGSEIARQSGAMPAGAPRVDRPASCHVIRRSA